MYPVAPNTIANFPYSLFSVSNQNAFLWIIFICLLSHLLHIIKLN